MSRLAILLVGAITASGGILDAASVTGSLTLNSGDVLTLKNAAGFTGTGTINNATLYLGTNLTAAANSAYVFTGAGSYLSYASGGPYTLTLPATASLTRSGTGNTYVYDSLINNGTVTVSGGALQFQSGTTLTNAAGATTTVSGSGSSLYLVGLANSGTLSANTSGLIQLGGAFTTANLGTVTLASGGAIKLTGTLTNTAATLAALMQGDHGDPFAVLGLHPLGGRWIQEHYTTRAGQETYSYYGPLNKICFNMGFHNEHHDFPAVPWNKLPELRRIAPESYDSLKSYDSWVGVLRHFIFDRSMSAYSRMVHPSTIPAGPASAAAIADD